MKKSLLFVAFFVSVSAVVSAQCTPNNAVTAQGFRWDDNGHKLPDATAYTAYSATITAVVPSQVTISGFNVTVDSIKVTGIPDLPAGLSYQTDKSSWPGGTKGCILISGTPVNPTNGIQDTIQIKYTAYGMGLQAPFSYDSVNVLIKGNVGVASLNPGRFEVLQNYPNPFTTQSDILFNSPVTDNVEFKVFDMLGKMVYSRKVAATPGINRIHLQARDFAPGIYVYSVSNGESTIIKRMTINK